MACLVCLLACPMQRALATVAASCVCELRVLGGGRAALLPLAMHGCMQPQGAHTSCTRSSSQGTYSQFFSFRKPQVCVRDDVGAALGAGAGFVSAKLWPAAAGITLWWYMPHELFVRFAAPALMLVGSGLLFPGRFLAGRLARRHVHECHPHAATAKHCSLAVCCVFARCGVLRASGWFGRWLGWAAGA